MNIATKIRIVAILTRLVVIVIIGKVLGLLLLWILPNEGVDFYEQKRMLPPHKSYTVGVIIEPQVVLKGDKSGMRYLESGINSMLLKGLYRKKRSGFVIVAMKVRPDKTEVLGIGDSFSGYKLIEVKASGAIFEKGSHHYTLELIQTDLATLRKTHVPFIEGEPYQMSRIEVQEYAKNFGAILEDISIIEVKDRGKVKGFKITRIRPHTPFSYLGLRKGDIIIKVNNEPLKSYADALNIYQNIDDIKEIELIVLRNNKEKELRYEIY